MAATPTYKEKYLLAITLWWLLWVLLQWNVIFRLGYNKSEAIIDSVISNILLCLACFVVFNNMRYYIPKQQKHIYLLTISTILGSLWLICLRFLLGIIFRNDNTYITFLAQSSTIRFGFSFLMIGFMSTICLLWYSQKEQMEIEANKKEMEQLAKDAELFNLRQQLQPHFLFNSLNSISALTGSQPEKAREMIQQLSDFLRSTLRKENHHWNSLEDELNHLGLYLSIEKVRFGHRLQTEIMIEGEIGELQVPSLLLQPVVENAIKFGLYNTIGDVLISIYATQIGNNLQITVQNPFDSSTIEGSSGTGFGLQYIKRRLFLLFGRNDLLQTIQESNTFITQLNIPQ